MHDCSTILILPNLSGYSGPIDPTHLLVCHLSPLSPLANDNARRRSRCKIDVIYCVFVSSSLTAAYLPQRSAFRSEAVRKFSDDRRTMERNKADGFMENTAQREKNSLDGIWIHWYATGNVPGTIWILLHLFI